MGEGYHNIITSMQVI